MSKPKKILKITVTLEHTIEVDADSEIVKEYDTEAEMIADLVSYHFSEVLPVVNHGVSIIDTDVINWETKKGGAK